MKIDMELDLVKLEIYVPEEYIEKLQDELAAIGACRVGNYSHVVSYQESKVYWKPLEESKPYNNIKILYVQVQK